MNDSILTNHLNDSLHWHLSKLTSEHVLSEAYFYAVIPAGKLFRPKLVWNTFLDLDFPQAKEILENKDKFRTHPMSLLAIAIEIHHAYTLVHDDLPAMDNDLFRRGKPSLHAKYGHWQAILVGDGLLNISYQILAKLNHPEALNVIKIFSHATGPKGLIEGQVLDLSEEMNKDLESLIRTHELKTARLIQSSLSLAALIATSDKELATHFWRLGLHLGVVFQLLDDLIELTDSKISLHENSVNPFLKHYSRTFPELLKHSQQIEKFLKVRSLPHLQFMIHNYLRDSHQKGKEHFDTIIKHIENSYPISSNEKQALQEFLNRNFSL